MLIDYLQQTLEARGIGCVARNRYLQGAVGELPVNECWPELWVLDDRDERLALDIVSALLQDGSGGEHWRCPGCGERMEGQFDQCWNCGMERPKPVGAR